MLKRTYFMTVIDAIANANPIPNPTSLILRQLNRRSPMKQVGAMTSRYILSC